MRDGVSVIVLAGNECENVEQVVEQCLVAPTAFPTEVIVVADASLASHRRRNTDSGASSEPDYTNPFERLQPLVTKEASRVRMIYQNAGANRAAAMANGFRQARHSYWVVIDANNHHPPEELSVLVHALADGADIALPRHRLSVRDYGKRAVLTVLKVGLGVSAVRSEADILSGFFAIRRDTVETADLDPWGYTILLDLLVKSDRDTTRIDEVPLTTDERKSQCLSWAEYQTVIEQAGVLSFRRFKLDRFVTPIRAVRATEYAFIGGIGTVINMLVFAGGHLGLGMHYILAGMLAFVIALNWNFVGNWALTFDRPHDGFWYKYWKFIAISLGGLVLYSGLLTISIRYLHLPALLGNGIAIGGAAAFNFLGAEMFAFAMSLPE